MLLLRIYTNAIVGPISAAVYLHELKEIESVMEWYVANNTMRQHVDIHLVLDDKVSILEKMQIIINNGYPDTSIRSSRPTVSSKSLT